jgi:16S rRNA processing protein RimM
LSSPTDPVAIGRIGKPHGVRGEVTVEELTDYPDRFRAGATFVSDDRTLTISSLRRHRGVLLLRFDGVADRESAEALRGTVLTIEAADRRSLEGDEFWPDQLEGLKAMLPDGTQLGTVTGVAFGPAQDRLVIATTAGTTIEIPFVDELVSDVHPSGGFVVVDPPPGLD